MPYAEIKLTSEVCAGESSKELEVQRNRIQREKETSYQTLQHVAPNPREPWDSEMDYDDTLTPEVPVEQLPEVDEDAPTDEPIHEKQTPFVAAAGPSSCFA